MNHSPYIDAHSHIHDTAHFEDQEEVYTRMIEAGVVTITVGTHLDSSEKAVEFAEKHDGVFATIGIHPTDTKEIFEEKDFVELAKSEKVVAIGECGLDYHHESDSLMRDKQKENFIRQIEFALKIGKPLMIHCRPSNDSSDAHEDLISIITPYVPKGLKANVHFFTGSEEVAKQYFDLGFTVSIPGVVTFARVVRKVVENLPLDRIISETDCPFAAPVPHRGERNEPAFVVDTVKKIAELQGKDVEEVKSQIFMNAESIFGPLR